MISWWSNTNVSILYELSSSNCFYRLKRRLVLLLM
ncbi:hypothetical protein CoNPh17_CDS0066 [Staphylococcus phage S-CoN_Ph17]|nr:hypothetical protein CoNPh17_CDS0066 [Staphylococcus phage S-CoN_Ph17]